MSRKIEVDTKTFVRFWLVLLGFALLALFIMKAATGLLIVGVSLFLAIAISPLVRKIAKVFPWKGQVLPTALAYIVVIGVLVGILAVIVPAVVSESVKFVTNLPDMVGDVSTSFGWINDLGNRFGLENLQGQIVAWIDNFSAEFLKDVGSIVMSSVGAVGSFFASAGITLVLTFLMLLEGPNLLAAFWRGRQDNPKAMKFKRTLDRMADVVATFVSRYLLIALIDGLATVVVIFILALIFGFSPGLALPFGLITGVLSIIPMFGPIIAGALVGILLAFSNIWAGIIFVVYFIVFMQIEGNIITPKIQGKGLKLPTLVVLISVTVGMYMFGLVGAIIAIPIAGCVRVLIEEYGSRSEKKVEKVDDTDKVAEKAQNISV